MKTVANLFAQTYAKLGSDHQKDRHFMSLERLAPDEDPYCTFVKRVESVAQNEYWIAREKNILMLLKRTPHVVRLRKEEKNNESYQTIKTKDAGISLAHWLRTKPRLADSDTTLNHPFVHAHSFLQLAKGALNALKEIHEAGVIHSQLRPDNLCIPYNPYPYHFDTSLNLDYSKITLIDFMFAVSNTLKLSRFLPVTISSTPSTQSTLIKHALKADQEKRQADVIQRIDYSVDLYALGFILQQIFQQDLIYPQGLEAELSMGIHRVITQLLSYDEGIPDNIKVRYLHLLPHKDYLLEVEQLLEVSLQGITAGNMNLLFDPAQFLEADSVFHLDEPIVDLDIAQSPTLNTNTAQTGTNIPIINPPPLVKPIENTPMKDAQASQQNYIEISKVTVILLIVSLQILYVIYTEGNKLGLDVVSSMGAVISIAVGLIIANKLFSPPKPLPKLQPITIEPNNNNTALTAEGVVAMTNAQDNNSSPQHEDELQTEQPISPPVESELDTLQEQSSSTAEAMPSATIDSEVNTNEAHIDESSTANKEPEPASTEAVPPIVLLKSASAATAQTESKPLEINKWLVIAVVVACQLSYIWYTTDLTGKAKPSPMAATPTETPEPTVAIEEPLPDLEPMPSEAAPLEDMTDIDSNNNDSAAANIELLSEASSVKTPEIAPAKPKKPKATETDSSSSVLLSGSPTAEPKAKKVKEPTVSKELAESKQPAIPLTKEQAQAADKTPPATIDVEEITAAKSKAESKTDTANADSKAASDKPSPKSLTRGLAEAQNVMGWSYYHGNNVKQDYEEAFKWFQKAANLGEASAQFNVGMMYAAGTGVKQDLTEAAKWYRKSAEQGKASAQLNLGMMYISGRGIRQNIEEGKKWLTKAAEQGDMTAKANLSWLIQQGYVKDEPAGE
ncbi:MAG: SEL1-like repeat protein [Moraxellaceae bacterium]|nr:SEL1-like repeat protein [Moraxellaceae bacterium]MCP5177115.1 SEL1-like repeat protein [Moraxellaceae bacterium]